MRYLPNTEADRTAMLKTIGVKNVNELFADVPADKMLKSLPDLPLHLGEQQVEAQLSSLARKNLNTAEAPSFIGAGSYRHHVPATVDYIIQRSEFLTAYTPYQPEIAQGTLMYLFEFQTYVANMTGMDVANASMYDGATSLAEAALMAQRVTKRKNITVAPNLHPHYLETLQTYMATTGGEILFDDKPSADCAAFIIQSPDFLGTPHILEGYRKACDETGSMLIHAFTEVLSLGMLSAPAEADIVVGDGQSIGVGLNYGGPHLGLFACKEKFIRQMPGRLCGKTEDAEGKESYVLTLNTREQHIRREKATSNICTNVGLCALAFTVHMSLLGEKGFKKLAHLNHERACMLADALEATGKVKLENSTFFNEFAIELTKDSADVVKQLADKGILAGYSLGGKRLLVSATELTSEDDIATFAKTLKEVL